ncbi:MAG: Rieske (2Fe-2S) protein [Candidatus Kapaibacterium sp.]
MTDEIDEELFYAALQELNGIASRTDPACEAREFVYACPVSEIPANGRRGKAILIEESEVAIFNIGGEIFAISNICPHEMSPLLAAGFVDCEARTVACPLHGWTFEIPTGKLLCASGSVPVYEVKVDAGEVWLRLRE